MKEVSCKVLLYLKRSSLTASGQSPIMCRETVGRSMVQFSSKLTCTPALWNVRERRLSGKSREAVETNARIEKLLLGIHEAVKSLSTRPGGFDAEAVKCQYQGSLETRMTLLRLLNRYIEGLRSRVGIDCARTTLSTYVYTRCSLEAFIRRRFGLPDLAFGQLNEQFIREYQDFTQSEQGYALQTVRHYLAVVKKICRLAFKEGHSEKLHFAYYKLPRQVATTPKALSRASFEKIRDLDIPAQRGSLSLSRDLFLFACYTGTSYADVSRLTGENLYTDESGALWLKYRRKKTDYQARVKLLPEALALLDKYRDAERETLFPYQSAEVVKANMKGLRGLTGIPEALTYHAGRHSFASLITLDEGVPIETISRMLGHSNIQTTQIYARVTPRKLFEDMDRLIAATSDLKLIL